MTWPSRSGRCADPLTRSCVVGASIGFVPYLLLLWDFGIHPLRRVTAAGVNADFFDIQGRALLHGHLDVPPGSIGIEAFVVGGRHYMYFGPLPALLRLPVLAVTDRLDGKMTALSMLAGWVVLAVAMTATVRRVRLALRGGATVGRLESFGLAAVVAAVTGGSTIVFLASQPWVYHEVYVWSTALTLATVASLIAAWDDPTLRRVLVTAALATATILTRVTAGWAMCLALVATGAVLVVAAGAGTGRRRAGWALTVAGAIALAVGAGVNLLKFRHPYLFPIGDQVWTRLSPHRRLILNANGGSMNGMRFAWTTITAYFRPDGVRLFSLFPFISPPARPPAALGAVRLDEALRTGSVPALMPALSLLTIWGTITTLRRRRRAGAAALRIPLLGTAAMTGGVIAFGHVAQRYTSEFVPLLALGATIAVVDVAARMQTARRATKRAAAATVAVLVAYSLLAHVAIGTVNSRQNWRGDRLTGLIAAQLAVSDVTGRPIEHWVRHVDELPDHGDADELAVVGECDALYVGTGEIHGSWVPVEFRDLTFRLDVSDSGSRPGSTSLAWFSGHTLRRLLVQVNLAGRLRLVLVGSRPNTSGHWIDVAAGTTVGVTVHGDTGANRFVATAELDDGSGTSATSVVRAPMTEWNRQFRSVPITRAVALSRPARAGAVGLTIEAGRGPEPDLCSRLP